MRRDDIVPPVTADAPARAFDPIGMEVFSNRLLTITEDMGNNLIRSSFSTNIKERKDCSVGLFDTRGRLIAQASIRVEWIGVDDRIERVVVDRAHSEFPPLGSPEQLGGDLTLISSRAARLGGVQIAGSESQSREAELESGICGCLNTSTANDTTLRDAIIHISRRASSGIASRSSNLSR